MNESSLQDFETADNLHSHRPDCKLGSNNVQEGPVV